MKNENPELKSLDQTSDLTSYINIIKSGETVALENLLSDQIKVTSELLLYVYDAYQKMQTIQVGTANHQSALLFFTDELLISYGYCLR
ncbi:hypothetical protein [Pedobacter sp. NJ-S-72]